MARTLNEPRRKPTRVGSTGTANVARGRNDGASRPNRTAGGAPRPVANEDPGYDRPPDDDDGSSAGNPALVAPSRAWPRQSPRPNALRGRASSASTRGMAASLLSEPTELEALRWALVDPNRVVPWLDSSFFANAVCAEAFDLLLAHGDLRDISDAVDGMPDESGIAAKAVELLHRLAMESPVNEAEQADDAIGRMVRNVTARVIAELTSGNREATAPGMEDIGPLKVLLLQIDEPRSRPDALNQLVPWLAAWARQQRSETLPPTT